MCKVWENKVKTPKQALGRLREAEEAAAGGRHQFLSGVLHNLAKVFHSNKVEATLAAKLQAVGLSKGAVFVSLLRMQRVLTFCR